MSRCGKRAQSAPRHEPDEVALDFLRILLAREAEPLRQPADVGVDDDPLRMPELGGDDVRRLAPDAGQAHELVERRVGTSPSNSSRSIRIVPWIDFAFWRKKPVA